MQYPGKEIGNCSFSCLCALGVDKPGSHVGPGEVFAYTWQVLEGPSSSDPPCVPYLYYSATNPTEDTNSGLVGPLLVCKKGTLGENGTQVIMTVLPSTPRDESKYSEEEILYIQYKEGAADI